MLKKLAILFFFFQGFNSCKKDPLKTEDHFIFGRYFGFCAGDCAHFYKLEKDGLYSDDMTRMDAFRFKTEKINEGAKSDAESLRSGFPSLLNKYPDSTFGCPDCADQGGIAIEVISNGHKKSWRLDTHTDALPDELKPFALSILDFMAKYPL
ncbi:MAG: hypothetical protein H6605_10125 [Flavobacteriales bacterium]|nr:hypothetical protein [Flavobacteriales bacterium]